MNSPLISVIIPSYNRGKTIERSVRSVLGQTYSNLQVIVVDDGSTDSTPEIIKSIQDSRIVYYKQPQRLGACAARNKGVELAQGAFVAFQDSDDAWHTDKLEKQLQFLLKNNYEFTYTGLLQHRRNFPVRKIFSPCSEAKEDVWRQLLSHNRISTQTILCYKYCFEKIQFDTQLKRLQDWDLALQASRWFRIGGLNEYLVDVYEQPDSITNQEKLNTARHILLDKQLPLAQERGKRFLSDYYKKIGRAFCSTEPLQAAKYYYKSFKLQPHFSTLVMGCLSALGTFKLYHDIKVLYYNTKSQFLSHRYSQK